MNLNPSEKIKEFRLKRGFSQEQLAEISKISIRTIQRMEKGETHPKGDSLKKIAKALETTTENLLSTDKKEDLGVLSLIVISGISYLIHPFLGILLPIILWYIKRDVVINADIVGKKVINFQISWQIIFFIFFIIVVNQGTLFLPYNSGITTWSTEIIGHMHNLFLKYLTFSIYILNLVLTLINLIIIRKEKLPRYFISFPFL